MNRKPDTNDVASNLATMGDASIAPTTQALTELDSSEIDLIVREAPGGARNIQDILPLSPLQEGMLFHRLMDDQHDTYVLSALFELRSRAHGNALIAALEKVICRHDTLRCAILWERLSRPVQIVYRRAALPIEELALVPGLPPIEQLRERMKPGRSGLDVRRAPLMRLQLAAASGGEIYAVLHVHHLICDHHSFGAVIAESLACIAGEEHTLATPRSLRNYVADSVAAADTSDAQAFFRDKLADIDEPTVPFGVTDSRSDGGEVEEARQTIEPALSQAIRELGPRLGVSAARLFHAAWALVVAATSGRDDVVYGTVLLDPQQRGARVQRPLGMSVNTLPLRMALRGLTVDQLVAQVHRELADLTRMQHVPLSLAQRCSGVAAGSSLFTAILNYRRNPSLSYREDTNNEGVRVLARAEAWTSYPIMMTVDELKRDFVLTAQTARSIDPQRVMAYLQTALQSMVEAFLGNRNALAVTLPVLPAGERRQLTEVFNATCAPYPRGRLIHELFEEQAQRSPDAVAIEYEKQSITYGELNKRANRLASYLRRQQVGPDQLVAICVDRGFEMVIGLLGILKAGAAYVPLDPSYPAERIAYMLEDAAPRIVLTQRTLMARLPETAGTIVALDEDLIDIAEIDAQNIDSGRAGVCPDHLAYVIYTSGSTGRPKGVEVTHSTVVNFLTSMQSTLGISASDTLLGVTTISFDIAALEIYLPLTTGARFALAKREVALDGRSLAALIESAGVTIMQATPVTWQLLLQSGWSGRAGMKALCGGEALTSELARALVHRVGSLWNLYGPTETTIWSCLHRVEHADTDGTVVTIGRPIANTNVYVLDRYRSVVGIGVAGEIYIGGEGVARGYRNRADLTADRFVPDPFAALSTPRMYRTGDLGHWRADGALEYLGRNDQQIKIRGFRTELGEIEALLSRHRGVKQVVVVAREDEPNIKRLIAYIVATDAQEDKAAIRVEDLRERIRKALPEYMVPSAFVLIDRLPLTPNGKLDRRALPAPALTSYATRQYQPPQGRTERMLADIWSNLLRVERIGRLDNFFDLGGHSLLATRAVARIQAKLSVDMPIQTFFRAPTLQDLSAAVNEIRGDGGLVVDTFELGDLIDELAAMSDSEVQERLQGFATEGRE